MKATFTLTIRGRSAVATGPAPMLSADAVVGGETAGS